VVSAARPYYENAHAPPPTELAVRNVTAAPTGRLHDAAMGSEASSTLILETIVRERASRVALLETIDARAGVLLGFAAALTALTPQDVDPLVEIGRAAAVAGALTALATFWPREYGNLDVELVAASAGSESVFLERNLMHAQKEIVLGLTELIAKKIRRLRIAMVLIAGASASIAVGLALD
jgi:hypothetical protein